jgi:glucose/arabinose dehydrogenase
MTAPDDGTGRLLVAAQDGRVWVIQDGAVLTQPAVDLGPRIRSGGEQGLLGIAAHPDFPSDPRFFVNYTDEAGDTIVASLRVDPGDPNRIDPDSHRRLLFIDQPYANHNGGAVLFGPDGFLYVFTGDGGAGGDPHGNGQNREALLGKVLRIDVDAAGGDLGYVVPSDNPFAGGGGSGEIWHLGLRNPWRASFDRASGDLWIGDVGQSAWEEVDVARAGVGGLNFGWNVMEGAHCYREADCDPGGLTLPVAEYGRDLGCTIIGGYVYRGAANPRLAGAYLFADYCTGRIFAIDSAASELVPPVEVGSGSGSISAFGEGADGELYVLSLGGAISRVVAGSR